MTDLPPIALDPIITEAIKQGADISYSMSGGKDSSAAALAVETWLRQQGATNQRTAVHADLGQIEWPSTPAFVEEITAKLNLPLTVVRRRAGGLIERWQQRFDAAKLRYQNLETYRLIGPFSSAKLRFCTAETKSQPLGSLHARAHRGRTVISIVGLRREESVARAKTPVVQPTSRFSPEGNRHGTRIITWHPIADWTQEQVYAAHATTGFPLHEAYTQHDATRMGCSFCVLSCRHNLTASARAGSNTTAYRAITDIEIASSFSFQPQRWLCDIAPDLLKPDQQALIGNTKAKAQTRRDLEAALPPDLTFTRGWPPRVPTIIEANQIATIRSTLLAMLDLPNLYSSANDIRSRFAQLHEQKKC